MFVRLVKIKFLGSSMHDSTNKMLAVQTRFKLLDLFTFKNSIEISQLNLVNNLII